MPSEMSLYNEVTKHSLIEVYTAKVGPRPEGQKIIRQLRRQDHIAQSQRWEQYFAEGADEAGLRRLLLSKVPNFKPYKRFGPSLARVQRPILALVISGFILVAACLILSFSLAAITPQPEAPAPEETAPEETTPVSLGIQVCRLV